MGVLTPDSRQDGQVYQPHFVRYHHAYRSPMNSQRLNAEQATFMLDIIRLNEKAFTLQSSLNSQLSTLFENSTPLTGYTIVWADATTTDPVAYSNFKDISVTMDGYLKRLAALEQYK